MCKKGMHMNRVQSLWLIRRIRQCGYIIPYFTCVSIPSSVTYTNLCSDARTRLRASMVVGPFAETKGPRRAGTKPRKNLPLVARGRNPANLISPHPATSESPIACGRFLLSAGVRCVSAHRRGRPRAA